MGPGTHDRWRGSAAGTSAGAPTTIRLTVPAAPDHLHVLRIAVRVVAGRAGCRDDARSRRQAAGGAGFFEPVDRAAPEGTVLAELTPAQGPLAGGSEGVRGGEVWGRTWRSGWAA